MTGGDGATNDWCYGRSTYDSNGVTHHRHATLLGRPDIEQHAAGICNGCAAEKSCKKAREQDGLDVLGCTRRK